MGADELKLMGFIVTIIVLTFGCLFWALKFLLNNGIKDMKAMIELEINNFNNHCKLVSGNLHNELVAETKQRVIADNKIEHSFKKHGHKGLDNGGSKVTI